MLFDMDLLFLPYLLLLSLSSLYELFVSMQN